MRQKIYILFLFILTSTLGVSQDLIFCGTQVNSSFFSYQPSTRFSNTITTGQTLIRRIRVDQNLEQVFWSAGGLNRIQKVDANFLGTNRVNVKTGLNNVSTINIDAKNNKVYYFLGNTSTINVCDTNGNNTTTLINLPSSAPILGIEIDFENNFIYWYQLTNGTRRILRANLQNGSNQTTILSTSDFIFDIKLIKEDSSLLISNRNGNRVQKINTDGTNLITLISEPTGTSIGTLAGDFCNNSIYYYLNNSGNGLQIKKTDFQGSTPIVVLDTNIGSLSGFDVLYQFNIGQRRDFLGSNQSICPGDSINLNATVRGGAYLWNDNSTNPTLKVKQSGIYSVTVTAGNCTKVDSITVNATSNFTANLGTDTTICFGDSIILSSTTPSANYLWSDNSTSATLKVKQTGIYWVDVTAGSCTVRDSIAITIAPNIQPILGNDTILCFGDSIFLNATATGASYLWNDNSTNPTLKVKQAGIYSVTVSAGNCTKVDSITISINPGFSIDIGVDTLLCFGDSIILDATTPFGTYLWSNNSTSDTLEVTQAGVYWVEVTSNSCIERDSIIIAIRPTIQPTLGNDTILCFGDSIFLDATATGASYLWSDNSTNPALKVKQSGIYSVTVSAGSCSKIDSILVTFLPGVTVDLGVDSVLCFGDSITLNATTPSANYLWSDNSTNSTLVVKQTGTYWAEATLGSCSRRDSVNISIAPDIQPQLGNDTTLCNGDTILLDATATNSSYLWNDNSINPTLTIAQAGIYSVSVTNGNCTELDSILISSSSSPINLGNDTILPAGDSLTLDASNTLGTVIWSDNSTGQTLKVKNTGIYWVDRTISGCVTRDSITVVFETKNTSRISGVINDYSKINSINIGFCADTIIVNDPSLFSIGDKVLIIQMQGATADTTNSGIFGDLSSINSAGLLEFVIIQQIIGDTFVLSQPLTNNFNNDGSLQLVSFPTYQNAVITDTLTASNWNGEIGGILAFEVTDSLILLADLNTDGKGFRGGNSFTGSYPLNSSSCGRTDYFSPGGNLNGGRKGEGIGKVDSLKSYGRGHFSNGGGGGNSFNAGGAGGANSGVGGGGGDEWSGCSRAAVGGLGGEPLNYSTFPNRVIMGGGGGAGDANDNLGSDGGNGGGIILLKAKNLFGLNNQITSKGLDAELALNDGAGGGGAGGSIFMDIETYSPNLSIYVDGGNGGNNSTSSCFGTGGGGSSGIIRNSNNFPNFISISISGGTAGLITSTSSQCSFSNYGATSGQSGISLRNVQSIFGVPPNSNTFGVNLGNDTTLCFGDSITLNSTAQNASFKWSNNSVDSFLVVKQQGTYWLDVQIENCIYSDTMVITIQPEIINNLGHDTTLCFGDSLLLASSAFANSYLWNTNSNESSIFIKNPGVYWLEVTVNGCKKRDSINVLFENPTIDSFLDNDTTLCDGDSIVFDISLPGFTYLWNNSSTSPQFTIKTAGTYSAQIIGNVCPFKDTIEIDFLPTPSFSLGNDTILCERESLEIRNLPSGTNYLWNTGSNDSTIQLNASGTYWLETLLGSCVFRDSINVTVNPIPQLNLGPDTTICLGDTITLSQNSITATYLWSDSTIVSSIKAFDSGEFWLNFTVNGCSTRDSILIETFDSIGLSFLPESAIICDNEVLNYELPLQNSTYVWQDGSTKRTYSISDSGLFFVQISNSCGNRTDSLLITRQCECEVITPTAFTPNNDFINDQFISRINCELETYSLKIFNRWGEEVFQSAQQSQAWDGTKYGIKQKDGVYFYVLRFKAPNESLQTIKGNVLLSR